MVNTRKMLDIGLFITGNPVGHGVAKFSSGYDLQGTWSHSESVPVDSGFLHYDLQIWGPKERVLEMKNLILTNKTSEITQLDGKFDNDDPIYYTLVARSLSESNNSPHAPVIRPMEMHSDNGAPDFRTFMNDTLSAFAWSFNHSYDIPVEPFKLSGSLNLAHERFSCPGSDVAPEGSLDVDIQASADVKLGWGIVLAGRLWPARVDEIGVFLRPDFDIDGVLNVIAKADGTFNVGPFPIFSYLPGGLHIPGILTIGPLFQVKVRAIITPSTNLDATIGLGYKSPARNLFFPHRQDVNEQGPIEKKHTPLRVAVAQGGVGNIEAHLIPTVTFGISALGGLAEALVYWNVDGSSTLSLTPSSHETCVDLKAGVRLGMGAVGNLPHIGNSGNGTWVEVSQELAKWGWDLYEDCISAENHLNRATVSSEPQMVLSGDGPSALGDVHLLDQDEISGQLTCLPADIHDPQDVFNGILEGTRQMLSYESS
ncbi:hypothetical protein NEOLEDRAFT_1207544 [Neolentinus lepideus HHB14362 ss-1]|uniref:Uncharacterized protein n=1 Tax=Neolentinus lepideus HHB14362 ss-1 TaxID=1314782 RepID=A0A165RVI7_9AGAM|nr:hypothetical protein NEOLEDRAFT_1207544 [Neolentinus lepideus HHB14362 ss-1]